MRNVSPERITKQLNKSRATRQQHVQRLDRDIQELHEGVYPFLGDRSTREALTEKTSLRHGHNVYLTSSSAILRQLDEGIELDALIESAQERLDFYKMIRDNGDNSGLTMSAILHSHDLLVELQELAGILNDTY